MDKLVPLAAIAGAAVIGRQGRRAKKNRVGKCISGKVKGEGWDQQQAVAACLSMRDQGRLRADGSYIRQGRRAKGGYTRASIRKLGYTDAQINRALAALERTPSGRDAGPKGAVVATPPKAVRDAAYKGLKIRAQMPKSRQGGTDIGVGRAIQLALGQPLPERSIKRMRAYFSRHARDFRPGWDAPGDESKGYIAWLLWGGTPGRTWAEKQYKRLT
jgi:hypothetical protein